MEDGGWGMVDGGWWMEDGGKAISRLPYAVCRMPFAVCRMTMVEAEQIMPVNEFIRIHRSYIVSKRHIEKADKNQLYVNGRELPIGEMYQAQVSKLF